MKYNSDFINQSVNYQQQLLWWENPSSYFCWCWVIILQSQTVLILPCASRHAAETSCNRQREGGRELRRKRKGRDRERYRQRSRVSRKRLYCFQGRLAFPFRATTSLPQGCTSKVNRTPPHHKLYLVCCPSSKNNNNKKNSWEVLQCKALHWDVSICFCAETITDKQVELHFCWQCHRHQIFLFKPIIASPGWALMSDSVVREQVGLQWPEKRNRRWEGAHLGSKVTH